MLSRFGEGEGHDIAHIAYSFILMPARVLAFFLATLPSDSPFFIVHDRGLLPLRCRADSMFFHDGA